MAIKSTIRQRPPAIPKPKDLPPGSQEWARWVSERMRELQNKSGIVQKNVLVLGKDKNAVLNLTQRQGNSIRDAQGRITEAEEELVLAQERLDQAREDLDELNEVTLPALETEMGQNSHEIEQLQGRMNDVDNDLSDLNTELSALDSDLSRLRTDLDDTTQNLQNQIDQIVIDGDGGVSIVYSVNPPSGTAYKEGSTWFQWDNATNRAIIGQWNFNGTAWESVALSDQIIPNLSAGKITTGTLDADRIGANSVTAEKIAAGAVVAGKVAADAITGNEIAAGSITAADAVFATGAIKNADIGDLNAGKINAGTLAAARIAGGSITGEKLAANTITTRELTSDNITGLNIVGSTITGTTIVGADITGTNTLTGGALNVVDGSITIDSQNAGVILEASRNGVPTLVAYDNRVELGSSATTRVRAFLEATGAQQSTSSIKLGQVVLSQTTNQPLDSTVLESSYGSPSDNYNRPAAVMWYVVAKNGLYTDGGLQFRAGSGLTDGITPVATGASGYGLPLWGPDRYSSHQTRFNDSVFFAPVEGNRGLSSSITLNSSSGVINFNSWNGGFSGVVAASGGIRVGRPGTYAIDVVMTISGVSGSIAGCVLVNGVERAPSQISYDLGTIRRLHYTIHTNLSANDLVQLEKRNAGTGTLTTNSFIAVTRVNT